MKRRLRDGSFPSAVRSEDGAWLLSVEDLLGAGLTLRGPGQVTDQVQSDVPPGPDPGLVDRIAVLERLLAIEQIRREAAEQIAADREKRAQTGGARAADAGASSRTRTAARTASTVVAGLMGTQDSGRTPDVDQIRLMSQDEFDRITTMLNTVAGGPGGHVNWGAANFP